MAESIVSGAAGREGAGMRQHICRRGLRRGAAARPPPPGPASRLGSRPPLSTSRPRLEWEARRSEGVGCAGRSVPGRGVSPGAPRRGAPGCRGLRPLLASSPSFLPPAVAPVTALSQVTKRAFSTNGTPLPARGSCEEGRRWTGGWQGDLDSYLSVKGC